MLIILITLFPPLNSPVAELNVILIVFSLYTAYILFLVVSVYISVSFIKLIPSKDQPRNIYLSFATGSITPASLIDATILSPSLKAKLGVPVYAPLVSSFTTCIVYVGTLTSSFGLSLYCADNSMSPITMLSP